MVSLSPNRLNMSTGAQYMDDVLVDLSTASHNMVSDSEPILSTTGYNNFKKLNTIAAYSVHLTLSIVISAIGLVMATLSPAEKRNEAYFTMVYLRIVFWLITFLFDHLIRKRHNDLRFNGYHNFHRSMIKHNGISLNIVSAWNTLLLLMQALLQYYYGTKLWYSWFTPITCIAMLQISETGVLIITHSTYITKVHNFNKTALSPDAMVGTNLVAGSLGIMQPGGNLAELLEKQADLIDYFKDHNQKLKQKLHQMQLNSRVVH